MGQAAGTTTQVWMSSAGFPGQRNLVRAGGTAARQHQLALVISTGSSEGTGRRFVAPIWLYRTMRS